MPDQGHARLFVALPLPPAMREALAGLAPATAPGVRPLPPAALHLTLHFLGTAAIANARAALTPVAAPSFTVALSGPGQFGARGARRTLYVGVASAAALRWLHAELGTRLAAAGFALESRPFVPHITLARLAAGASAETAAAFLRQRLPAEARHFESAEFALYASDTLPEGARYRVLERYPLAAGGGTGEA